MSRGCTVGGGVVRGFAAAQRAYDALEPRESALVVRLSGGATISHLATLIDEHGIDDLRVSLRRDRYHVTACTDDCEEEAVASDLAQAIEDAINAVVTAQRENERARADRLVAAVRGARARQRDPQGGGDVVSGPLVADRTVRT